MEFKEVFRQAYRTALHAARANDEQGVIDGFSNLYNIFDQQYRRDNGDPIVIKAKLAYWRDSFGTYLQIVKKYGIHDVRVLKLFGLIDNVAAPSFDDIMSGKGKVSATPISAEPTAPFVPNDGGIDLDGIISADPQTPAVEPVAPADVAQVPFDEQQNPRKDEQDPIDEIILPAEDDATEGEGKPWYTPPSLQDFIGQPHIVKALLKEIAIARQKGLKHLDNILLLGNPGLGKTLLMELIAKELGVRFELLDCSQFRNSQQSLKALQNFFMRVARNNEPVVIALDEIHMLNNELQSSLLTLLNNRVYVSPLDINGQCKRIPIDDFTFIAATTDDDKVLDTIKNRCLRLKFQMVDYTFDELKRIYKNKVAAKGLTITDEAIDTCIPRSRGAIRYVNSIVDGLENALYNDEGVRVSSHITLDTALGYFKDKGIDPMGLELKDLEILQVIADDTSGAISADVLSARVGLDTKKYLSEHERYLIKIGFVWVSGRGRSLTQKAIAYIKGAK